MAFPVTPLQLCQIYATSSTSRPFRNHRRHWFFERKFRTKKIFDAVFLGESEFCTEFDALNYFFKRGAAYNCKAWRFRNLRAFEFFLLILVNNNKVNFICSDSRVDLIEQKLECSPVYKFLRLKMVSGLLI